MLHDAICANTCPKKSPSHVGNNIPAAWSMWVRNLRPTGFSLACCHRKTIAYHLPRLKKSGLARLLYLSFHVWSMEMYGPLDGATVP